MISQTVNYVDFDDQKQVGTYWFHLTKQDVLDHLELKEDFEALQQIFTAEKRSLSILEIKQILDLVKLFAELSYGERSEDGKRFKKGTKYPEVWADFSESAAYDEFLTGLFVPDPSKAFEFLLAVMPKDLRSEAEAEVKRNNPEIYANYEAAKAGPPVPNVQKTHEDGILVANTPVPDDSALIEQEERAKARRAELNNLSREELLARLG